VRIQEEHCCPDRRQRYRIGNQVGEVAVRKRRGDDAHEAAPLPWPHAERRRIEIHAPVHQVNEPQQSDEAKR